MHDINLMVIVYPIKTASAANIFNRAVNQSVRTYYRYRIVNSHDANLTTMVYDRMVNIHAAYAVNSC